MTTIVRQETVLVVVSTHKHILLHAGYLGMVAELGRPSMFRPQRWDLARRHLWPRPQQLALRWPLGFLLLGIRILRKRHRLLRCRALL